MNLKTKLFFNSMYITWSNHRARKLAKRISKEEDIEHTKYPEQWKADYIIKKSKKFAKKLNVEVEVIGWENLPKAPAILAPNHSSAFDPALIMIGLANPGHAKDDYNHQAVFLAKEDLVTNKKAIGYMNMINTFFLSRTNPREALKTLDSFSAYAKANKKYAVVFPSGTRSKDGSVGKFLGGAFRSAKKSFVPIVPVTINNALSITDTDRVGKLKVQVIFGKYIKPMSLITQDTKDIATKVEKLVKKNWVKPEGKRSANEDKLA